MVFGDSKQTFKERNKVKIVKLLLLLIIYIKLQNTTLNAFHKFPESNISFLIVFVLECTRCYDNLISCQGLIKTSIYLLLNLSSLQFKLQRFSLKL